MPPDDVLARCIRVCESPGSVTLTYVDRSGRPVEEWTILAERYTEAKLYQWEQYVLGQELGAARGVTNPGLLTLLR